MHSVSLCRGLSLLLLLAQLAMADDSLGLGNIHPGDTPQGLSLSTFSPPDGSLSSEDLGINAATEPFTADGSNWGKSQGSFKNGDSLELASGAGNCKSDAGNTRPGRRRLRRDNDFCSSGYSQFKPSLPKVSHDPAGWGGGLWRTPAAGPFSHAPLANRFYPEGVYMYLLQTQPPKSDIQNLLDVFPVNRGGPDRDPEPEQSNLLMPYFGRGSDAEKSACANSGVKTVGNIPVCALDSDAVPAFPDLVALQALGAIVNLKAWTPCTFSCLLTT